VLTKIEQGTERVDCGNGIQTTKQIRSKKLEHSSSHPSAVTSHVSYCGGVRYISHGYLRVTGLKWDTVSSSSFSVHQPQILTSLRREDVWRNGYRDPRILDPGTRRRRVVNFTNLLLYPWRKTTSSHPKDFICNDGELRKEITHLYSRVKDILQAVKHRGSNNMLDCWDPSHTKNMATAGYGVMKNLPSPCLPHGLSWVWNQSVIARMRCAKYDMS
jgi:hypothetical protein